VFSGLVLGLGINLFVSGTGGLWMSLKGAGLAFVIYFPLYLLRGIGAGDVKLATAVGAIVGPVNWFGIFVWTLAFRGIAALILILTRRRLRRSLANIRAILTGIGSAKAPYANNSQLDVRSADSVRLPHAAIIALGTLAFLVASAVRTAR